MAISIELNDGSGGIDVEALMDMQHQLIIDECSACVGSLDVGSLDCNDLENNDDFYTCEVDGAEDYFECENLEGVEFDACTDKA